MKKELEALKKRIAELEAEVAGLKARPAEQHHYHYYPQPLIGQQPYQPTVPGWPYPGSPTWTSGAGDGWTDKEFTS